MQRRIYKFLEFVKLSENVRDNVSRSIFRFGDFNDYVGRVDSIRISLIDT